MILYGFIPFFLFSILINKIIFSSFGLDNLTHVPRRIRTGTPYPQPVIKWGESFILLQRFDNLIATPLPQKKKN